MLSWAHGRTTTLFLFKSKDATEKESKARSVNMIFFFSPFWENGDKSAMKKATWFTITILLFNLAAFGLPIVKASGVDLNAGVSQGHESLSSLVSSSTYFAWSHQRCIWGWLVEAVTQFECFSLHLECLLDVRHCIRKRKINELETIYADTYFATAHAV